MAQETQQRILVTVPEAAALLAVSPPTVYRLIRNKTLVPVMILTSTRLRVVDLERLFGPICTIPVILGVDEGDALPQTPQGRTFKAPTRKPDAAHSGPSGAPRVRRGGVPDEERRGS